MTNDNRSEPVCDAVSLRFLFGNGVGSFGAAGNFGVGAGPFSVAVGDFNLDGKPDLATANRNSGSGVGQFRSPSKLR